VHGWRAAAPLCASSKIGGWLRGGWLLARAEEEMLLGVKMRRRRKRILDLAPFALLLGTARLAHRPPMLRFGSAPRKSKRARAFQLLWLGWHSGASPGLTGAPRGAPRRGPPSARLQHIGSPPRRHATAFAYELPPPATPPGRPCLLLKLTC
jgi:hypothetical protein